MSTRLLRTRNQSFSSLEEEICSGEVGGSGVFSTVYCTFNNCIHSRDFNRHFVIVAQETEERKGFTCWISAC